MKQWLLEQHEKDVAPDCPRCGVNPYDDGSFYDEDHICVVEEEEPDYGTYFDDEYREDENEQ